jgi:VRR-NUC domain
MRREEWRQQTELCRLLDRWLPADAFWTATDPIAPTALSVALRRLRGVKRGVPDVLIWCRRTRPIVIEMKSPGGRCTAAQRATREALIAAGCDWWECRSANAATQAIAESGVKFRVIVHADGTPARWTRPKLEEWEVPRCDPAERRPQHPAIRAQRREYARRRERTRARALEVAATRRDDGARSERRAGSWAASEAPPR